MLEVLLLWKNFFDNFTPASVERLIENKTEVSISISDLTEQLEKWKRPLILAHLNVKKLNISLKLFIMGVGSYPRCHRSLELIGWQALLLGPSCFDDVLVLWHSLTVGFKQRIVGHLCFHFVYEFLFLGFCLHHNYCLWDLSTQLRIYVQCFNSYSFVLSHVILFRDVLVRRWAQIRSVFFHSFNHLLRALIKGFLRARLPLGSSILGFELSYNCINEVIGIVNFLWWHGIDDLIHALSFMFEYWVKSFLDSLLKFDF